jgi:PAS domain S-box-containing protein
MVTASDFLTGGEEMAARISAFDWSKTPIGSAENWSPALRMMVRVLIANRFPMLLWWGPDYTSIYNDAYIPILGQKHPWALGRPVRECWSEIWDVLKPLIDAPFRGGPATWSEDIELQINRSDFTEETHFTIAYSPVPDETAPNSIGGVLATVHEISGQIIFERRGAMLRDLSTRPAEPKSAEDACTIAAATLAKHLKDVPFLLIYLLDADGRRAVLAGSAGIESAPVVAPPVIPLGDSARSPWPFKAGLVNTEMQVVENLASIFPVLPPGTWPDPPDSAAVIPIHSNIPSQIAGFVVAGLSCRIKFDEAYKTFLNLVTTQIGSAIANARAAEEERRRAEASAEIDRAKTTFFSNVSHEFRTPLTLMLGPLENILANGDALSPEVRDQVATSHRNSLRLLKLVNTLLDFSRIEAGKVKASYGPVDLGAITRDLASNFRSVIEVAGLELAVDCPSLPEPVFVDRDMWEKIVLNLLSNAFKFTFEGRISVSLEHRDGVALLTVGDTGIGIPEQELPRVFERFHRVKGARGRTYEGTGIGLALVQELVKLHGGSIQATSRSGEGSAFTVTLPLGSAHLPPDRLEADLDLASTKVRVEAFTDEAENWASNHRQANSRGGSHTPSAPRRPRILFADDNADMREHVTHILGAGYEVIAAVDGASALQAALDQRPDLLLCDVMMPGLDGFALLRELRRDPKLHGLPIILLSARAGAEARTEGISAGADDYLTKPFSASELTARVKTVLELHRSRQAALAQFETLLNQAPIGVFVLDSEFRIRQVNPNGRAFFGDIPNLVGRDFDEVAHLIWGPESADEIVRLSKHTLESGEPSSIAEHVAQRIDRGVTEYHHWRVDRIPLSDDRPGLVHYFRDIAGEIFAREEVARSGERFRAFVTATSDAVYRMSPDWNEMRQLRGRDFITDAESVSDSWLENYVPQADQPQVLEAIRNAVEHKNIFEMEHRVIHVDGSIGWTFSRAVPLFDDKGEIREWFGTARDITAQKRIQEQLREAAERFHFMGESMPQKIFTAKPNGEIDYYNAQCLEFTGLPFDEIRGWGWTQFVHPDDVEESVRLWRHSVETGEPFQFIHRFRGADGVYRWHLTRARAMRGEDGRILMWMGSNTDIHEQKHIEEDLRRANQDLEQFAYTASHDLQEPLRGLKIFSELLMTRYAPKLDGQALEFLECVRSSATRMESLVKDLLAYTQSTLLDECPEPADSAAALRVALDNLASAVSESQAKVQFDGLPSVKVHSRYLEQLFQNLVGNAIKYRRPGVPPRIRITAIKQDSHWLFCVSDNGIGIDAQYKDGIFGLFKRLHSDEYSGTGIGLAICQRIVDRYHGRIWVESNPGRGSSFYFTLPD